jgi:O-acetyl-ADP-ribose deacetylase (regulator of RNase III)
MAIVVREGDALAALEAGTIQALGHQVNQAGVMGAGIARQIRERWPVTLTAYRDALRRADLPLGRILPVAVAPDRWVVHLAGQEGIGSGRRQTDYPALGWALRRYAAWAATMGVTPGLPYGIGCGLAGGAWPVVEALIAEAFADQTVMLWRLP